MRYTVDTESKTISVEKENGEELLNLYSKEAFEFFSQQWLQLSWNQKYSYTFTWCGRPIIQLPEDLLRLQEVIYQLQPDLIIETGIAHGGSLIFYASLCKLIGKGRVLGIDIEIREHNRIAIEAHRLSSWITLIEGSSVEDTVVSQVKKFVQPQESVLVILDSNHTKKHVLDELNAYHSLVTPGSYIVATDGVMKDLAQVPRGKKNWLYDNPTQAALEFVKTHTEFVIEVPRWQFSESSLTENITHWPSAWLKKVN